MLVVGWGAGATAAAAALHPIERLTCVEIEPATFRAAPFFEALSGRVRRDPRFEIAFRDGRTHLLRTRDLYDVVVSEPSNPWITGVANLFTREFYATALARLAPGGVFGQWFHYYRFEPADVKVELRTFAAVFPHASLWLVPPVSGPNGPTLAADLLLVGSREPQSLEWDAAARGVRGRTRRGPAGHRCLARRGGPRRVLDDGRRVLRRYADAIGPGHDRPLNTDDHPLIELVAPRRNVRPRGRDRPAGPGPVRGLRGRGRVGSASAPRAAPAEAPGFATELGERYAEAGQPAGPSPRSSTPSPRIPRSTGRRSACPTSISTGATSRGRRPLTASCCACVRATSGLAPPRRRPRPAVEVVGGAGRLRDGPARVDPKAPVDRPSSTTSSDRPGGGGRAERRLGQGGPAGISAPPAL